jgi:Na+-driven multidrug efflux pump
MVIAASLNLICDPLLIFGIGPFPRLEIAGAALATVFARATAFCISLYVLHFRKRMISLHIPPLKTSLASWRQILYIGLPTAGTRIIIPLGMGVITRMIAAYGSESVAGYGVASRIEFFAMTVIYALSSVLGPFVGQNWGARQKNRVITGIRFSHQLSLAWGFFLLIVFICLAKPIASLFNPNPQVILVITQYLWIVPIAYGLQGVLLISASVLNVLKKPLHAAGLGFLQMFILYIPLAFIGSSLFGLLGIFGSLALSYLLAGSFSYWVLKHYVSKIPVGEDQKLV